MASYSPRKSILKSTKLTAGSDIFCQSSPLTFTFYSLYVCNVYLFIYLCYGFPLKGMRANKRFHAGSGGVIKISAVSLTPRDRILRSAESDSAVSLRIRNHTKCTVQVRSRGLNETAEIDPAVSLRPRNPNFANDYLDFLGEHEAICETALARELFDEKTEGQKSRDTVPLKGNHSKNKLIGKNHIHIVTRKSKYLRGTLINKSDPAVSLRPRDPILSIFESIVSTNTNLNAKRL
jgi:hypothetical protein